MTRDATQGDAPPSMGTMAGPLLGQVPIPTEQGGGAKCCPISPSSDFRCRTRHCMRTPTCKQPGDRRLPRRACLLDGLGLTEGNLQLGTASLPICFLKNNKPTHFFFEK
ncbi:hypothetical protein SEVIR_9G031050v4 [Setaria viridis]